MLIVAKANFTGIIFGIILGLCLGWIIKNKILDMVSPQLRFIEFTISNKISYAELIDRLIPILTPLGMFIEKSANKNGARIC